MKARHILFLCLSAAVALAPTGCSKTGEEKETARSEASPVKRGPNGESIVTLDPETQKRFGLQTQTPEAAQWEPELKGYGRVADPGPLASLATELVSAQAAADTSRREYERLKLLAAQTNASVRAVQSAESAAKRDQLLVESLRTKLTLEWGGGILKRDDPLAFVRTFTTGERTLVRLDLPPGERLDAPPSGARLVALADDRHPVAAEFFDMATTVDPQTQGRGLWFLVAGTPAGFSPNAAVTGYLKAAGPPMAGVLIPSAAVIRHDGAAWVYVQTGDTEFLRREIVLDRPAEGAWFVSSGVTRQDRLVVSGAQAVLSWELSGGSFASGARE